MLKKMGRYIYHVQVFFTTKLLPSAFLAPISLRSDCGWKMAMISHEKRRWSIDHDKERRWRLLPELQWYRPWPWPCLPGGGHRPVGHRSTAPFTWEDDDESESTHTAPASIASQVPAETATAWWLLMGEKKKGQAIDGSVSAAAMMRRFLDGWQNRRRPAVDQGVPRWGY
jgi:hypothetical protein